MNTFLPNLKKTFKNVDLFETALTHGSWTRINPNKRENNERMEFLGDAVLELVVSEKIYQRFPNEKEGFMTFLRANLVNSTNLAEFGRSIDIGSHLFLSRGEEENGGRNNNSLMANAVEALIGAIYLDQGFEVANKFINENIVPQIDEKLLKPLKDAKSRLQESIQAQGFPVPKYRIQKVIGPDHDKEFFVEVCLEEEKIGEGTGKSRAEAEQNAAEAGLAQIASKGYNTL